MSHALRAQAIIHSIEVKSTYSTGHFNLHQVTTLMRQAAKAALDEAEPSGGPVPRFTCAECGTPEPGRFVVDILDQDDPRHTRTELCIECFTELQKEA